MDASNQSVDDASTQQRQLLLHPEQKENSSRLNSWWRRQRADFQLSAEEDGGERFPGETILLKSVLLILGLLFMVSTTAFIISACALGLDVEGYDKWAANHSVMYVDIIGGAGASASSSTMTPAAAAAMERLEDMYKNLTTSSGG